jgi:hypothetical protein
MASEWDVVSTAPKSEWDVVSTSPKAAPAKPTEQMPMYDPMGGVPGYTEAKAPISKETREFERREGPFGYAKEYGKGVIAGAVGLPGEFINLPGTVAGMAGFQVPRAPIGVSEASEAMFGKPTSETAAGMRGAGEILGLPSIPSIASGAMKTLAGTAGALRKTAGAAKSLRPEKAIKSAFGEASSVSAVGEKAEKQISKKLEDLVNTRREEFKSVKDNYLNAGRQNEEAILDNYLSKINEHYAVNASSMSPEEIKLLKESVARLGERPVEITGKVSETVRPGFEALEKERRFLDDVTRGVKVEGAAAIPAQFAKDLSKMLEGSISQYVPKEFENFNTVYRTLSEPINQYGAALGQQVTKRAGEFLPDIPKIDPAKIPNAFFSSRRSINDLKALTGDEKFVNDLAREHVATEIRGVDKAEKIRDYVAKNYDWLQELPALRSELEALAGNLRNAERLKTGAKIGAGAYLGSAALNKTTKLFGD